MSAPDDLARVLRPGAGDTLDVGGHHYDYALDGPDGGPVALLVAGLSMHRCEWFPELIVGLHERGIRTLLADNRDAGLSRAADPDAEVGLPGMADDLLRLVDALGFDRIHAVGFSMGGMITQHLALRAPAHVASLVSLMSTSGARGVGKPREQCHWIFTEPQPAHDRDAFIDYALRYHRATVAPVEQDEARARLIAGWVFERGIRPDGSRRQLLAIRDDGDRTERLATLRLPSLVIHGTDDPMIDVSGGESTAAAIPGARFVTLEGAGHSVAPARAEHVAGLIAEHIRSAA